jgi:hypothetical protein
VDPMTKLRSCRQELADRGFFERTLCRIVAELAMVVAATLVGIGLLLLSDNLVVEAFAMWLIALAGMGVSVIAFTATEVWSAAQPSDRLDPARYHECSKRMWEYSLACGVAAALAGNLSVYQVTCTNDYHAPYRYQR